MTPTISWISSVKGKDYKSIAGCTKSLRVTLDISPYYWSTRWTFNWIYLRKGYTGRLHWTCPAWQAYFVQPAIVVVIPKDGLEGPICDSFDYCNITEYYEIPLQYERILLYYSSCLWQLLVIWTYFNDSHADKASFDTFRLKVSVSYKVNCDTQKINKCQMNRHLKSESFNNSQNWKCPKSLKKNSGKTECHFSNLAFFDNYRMCSWKTIFAS